MPTDNESDPETYRRGERQVFPEVVLQERAEDYSKTDIVRILHGHGFKRGGESDLESELLSKFLQDPDRNVLNIYGAKGVGKTMTVRMALALYEKEEVYLSYYKTREIPEFKPGKIVVIDDIHYIIDDIRAGKQTVDDLVSLLIDAFTYAHSGGKVIFISEDVFTPTYIDSPIYRAVYPELKSNEIFCRTNIASVLEPLEYKVDRLLREFLFTMRPNARGVVSFLKNAGRSWTVVCDKAITIALFDGDVKRKVERIKRTERLEGRKLSFERNPGGYPTKVWKSFNNEEKKNIWNGVIEIKMKEQEERKKRWEKTIDGKIYDSPEMKTLVKLCFEDFIFKDQSYYNYLMEAVMRE